MFAVAGVTGQTGRIVADTLLTRGHDVRVIVRDAVKGAPWQARGAEVAVAALDDEPALTRALTGVQGAYLLTPPDAVSPGLPREPPAADRCARRRRGREPRAARGVPVVDRGAPRRSADRPDRRPALRRTAAADA